VLADDGEVWVASQRLHALLGAAHQQQVAYAQRDLGKPFTQRLAVVVNGDDGHCVALLKSSPSQRPSGQLGLGRDEYLG
jgi:hypothetical protein